MKWSPQCTPSASSTALQYRRGTTASLEAVIAESLLHVRHLARIAVSIKTLEQLPGISLLATVSRRHHVVVLRTLPWKNVAEMSNTTMIIAAFRFGLTCSFLSFGFVACFPTQDESQDIQRRCRRKRVGSGFPCVDFSGAQPTPGRLCQYLPLVNFHFDVEFFELSHLLGSSFPYFLCVELVTRSRIICLYLIRRLGVVVATSCKSKSASMSVTGVPQNTLWQLLPGKDSSDPSSSRSLKVTHTADTEIAREHSPV